MNLLIVFTLIGVWELCKLEEVAKITMGQSPNSKNYTKNPNDYILVQGNADIKNGKVVPRVWTTQLTKQAEKGDLLLSVRAPVGDIGKTEYDVVIGRGIAGIKGNEFVFQQLSKMKDNNYWARYSTGSTFESISSNDIRGAIFFIPEKIEQESIGLFLKNIDNFIVLHQRKLDQLKELKKAYLQVMFPKKDETVPRVRFTDFEGEWEQCKLGKIGKTQSGIGFPDVEQGGTEGIPFYKVSDMNNPGNEHEMINANNFVNKEQLKRKKWKPIETVPAIMFAKVGAAIMLNRKRLVTSSFLIDNNTMAYIFDNSWDTNFGKTLFETINLPRYAQVGALPSYNGLDIESIEVILPNKDEQAKIGEHFSNLENLITLHQNKLEQLNELKKSYLQNMFI
ncbi:restriction endonuclease subunit S [Enterococcus faecalis]|uniref:restriction endonuclease subunit S n=1 Tax=Enterococcus faecalis TaxID=1351 RepID=UPI00311CE12A